MRAECAFCLSPHCLHLLLFSQGVTSDKAIGAATGAMISSGGLSSA